MQSYRKQFQVIAEGRLEEYRKVIKQQQTYQMGKII